MGRIVLPLICLLVVLVSSNALAQTAAGSKLVEASVGAASYGSSELTATSSSALVPETESTTTFHTISVSPSVGWFVKDDLAVGAFVGLQYFHDKVEQRGSFTASATNAYTRVNVGPFVRYYIGDGANGKPFVGMTAAFTFTPSTQKSSASGGGEFEVRGHYKGLGAGVFLGYEHFINQGIGFAVQTGVDYRRAKQEIDVSGPGGSGTANQTTSDWTVPLSVGLQIHLP